MAKTQCSICSDKNHKKIDSALVIEGATVRAIARQFKVGKDALLRHVKNGHIATKIAKAQVAQDIAEADDLLKEFNEVQEHQITIFREARKRKGHDPVTGKEILNPDNRLALEALRDRSKTIEFKGKMLGAFNKDKSSQGGGPVESVVIYIPENNRDKLKS